MIINMSGGRSGDTLTVTTPGAGITVTVSKDGKSKTKVSGADGVVVFKGLESGTWTVTISDGEQTAEKTVTVKNDYEAELTFFAATINVTYPAGSTCTATDGVTTLTAPDTSGVWACTVPNAGTWTVTVAGKGWTESVSITQNGQTASVYIDKYYLYREGNAYTSRTGGMLSIKEGTLTNEGECIKLTALGDTTGYFRFANLIQVSGFSTLKAIITYANKQPGGSINIKCASDAEFKNTISYLNFSYVGEVKISVNEFDSAYVGFSLYNGEIKFSQMWLE